MAFSRDRGKGEIVALTCKTYDPPAVVGGLPFLSVSKPADRHDTKLQLYDDEASFW